MDLGAGAVGAAFLTEHMRLPFSRLWFALACMAGWICGRRIGMDMRAHRESSSGADHVTARGSSGGIQQSVAFAEFGLLMFVFILVQLLRH